MDAGLHERTLAEGLAEVGRRGDHRQGRDAVPAGLVPRAHGGASLAANVALVLANAELAARMRGDGSRARSSAPDRERLTARGRS